MSDKAKRRRQARKRRDKRSLDGWALAFRHKHGRGPTMCELLKRAYPLTNRRIRRPGKYRPSTSWVERLTFGGNPILGLLPKRDFGGATP